MSTFASRDGTVLHEVQWPAASPRAGIALFHGYGEHIGRYDHVGRALAEHGFSVRAIDFRGHGQSAGVRGFCRSFDEYLDDIAGLVARCPERPLFLMGHSFGGLAVTEYLLRRGSDGFAGVILSSPYYALKLKVSPIKIAVGKLASSLVPKLTLPTGLHGADVARDPEIAALYDRDPLNNKNATSRWFTEATSAQEHVLVHAGELKLPLLMMQGGDDRVADPQVSKQVFERSSSSDKRLMYLEGQYHEVFNEPPEIRKQNLDALCEWLGAHVSAREAAST